MLKIFHTSLLICALVLGGCDALNDSSDETRLRVENRTQTDFTAVEIQFMGEPQQYGAVEAGAFSDYRTFAEAYRYGLVVAKTADTTYRLQPIDYVGESPLDAGRYTYRLTLNDEQLSLELIRE